MMRRLIVLVSVLALVGCLTACKSTGPKDFDEAMVIVDKAREIAKEQGVSWYADVTFDGSPEFYETASVGFKSGIEVRIHFQGNAGGTGNETPPESDEQ